MLAARRDILALLFVALAHVTLAHDDEEHEFGYNLRMSPAADPGMTCDDEALKRQSPVSLEDQLCSWNNLPPLKMSGHWNFRPRGILMHNTGSSVQLRPTGAKPRLSGGPLKGMYVMEQIHFHWGEDDLVGSEHKINGKFYGMECHLVHYKRDYGSLTNALQHTDGVAVLAIMFETQARNGTELESIVNGLSFIRNPESDVIIFGDSISWLRSFLETPGDYFSYHGSLTTPPCNEVVTWINLREVATVGVKQIAEFRQLLNETGPILSHRRELQQLGDRQVLCQLDPR